MIGGIALLAGTTALFMVPLLPAFIELLWPADVAALPVPVEFDTRADKFAMVFRQHIAERLGGDPSAVLPGMVRRRQYLHASGFHIVPVTGVPALDGTEAASAVCTKVLLGVDIDLQAQHVFDQEIYATRTLRVAKRTVVRALYAEDALWLAQRTKVRRWAHAGFIHVDRDCELCGRLTATHRITIAPGTSFARLNAPRIEFCDPTEIVGDTTARDVDRTRIDGDFDNRVRLARDDKRIIVRGDVHIPERRLLEEDVIAYGRLRIGSCARVIGSVKAHDTVVVEPGARVDGALIARTAAVLEPGSVVRGPVISEGALTVGRGCRVGSPDALSSVVAPDIRIAPGATVFGTVWARRAGLAVADSESGSTP